MPVILRGQDEIDTWLSAPTEEVLKLQRPLPDDALKIVAITEKERNTPEAVFEAKPKDQPLPLFSIHAPFLDFIGADSSDGVALHIHVGVEPRKFMPHAVLAAGGPATVLIRGRSATGLRGCFCLYQSQQLLAISHSSPDSLEKSLREHLGSFGVRFDHPVATGFLEDLPEVGDLPRLKYAFCAFV